MAHGVKHIGSIGSPRPSPFAPGTIVIVENGRSTAFAIQPGQRLVMGSDAGSGIVLDDPKVSPNHALITRLGPGWLVSSLDAANPACLLDPTGRAQPIETELGLRSGELLIGGCQVRLYPPAA
jgi:pSer/pThr/pTyr-binding forkhead associated (FHA) protein